MVRALSTVCAIVASAILLPAGIAAAAVQSRSSAPMTSTPQTAASKKVQLSLREIAVRVEAEGYQDIEEIEREGEMYEVCAKDKQGREVDLTVNANTGKIEKVEPCDD